MVEVGLEEEAQAEVEQVSTTAELPTAVFESAVDMFAVDIPKIVAPSKKVPFHQEAVAAY